jgi:DeoR family fructose operon transcriptional repressor
MLIEERMEEIVRIVEEQGSAQVQELIQYLNASESTVRRDLTILNQKGRLTKVHGGAIALRNSGLHRDSFVEAREDINREEKVKIAKYAASLVEVNDLVYLDSGTTTGLMIEFLKHNRAVFVTNAVMHARKLAMQGSKVYLPGGQFKAVTEAIIGEEVMESLAKYHFTKGFWGTNGADLSAGFTTPEIREGKIKQFSMGQCQKCYVLCDSSKIGQVSTVTFAGFEQANIITTGLENQQYQRCNNIIQI